MPMESAYTHECTATPACHVFACTAAIVQLAFANRWGLSLRVALPNASCSGSQTSEATEQVRPSSHELDSTMPMPSAGGPRFIWPAGPPWMRHRTPPLTHTSPASCPPLCPGRMLESSARIGSCYCIDAGEKCGRCSTALQGPLDRDFVVRARRIISLPFPCPFDGTSSGKTNLNAV
jgi:hypothetical protein